jgi:hypothetical protein
LSGTLPANRGAGRLSRLCVSERRKIAALAAVTRLPAIYGYREHVDDGGLVSYGVDLRACFRRGAYYVQPDQIDQFRLSASIAEEKSDA